MITLNSKKFCKNYNINLDSCPFFKVGATGKCLNKNDNNICYYDEPASKLEDNVMNEIIKFTCPICGTMFSEKIVDYKICSHCDTLIQNSMTKCSICNEELYEITIEQDSKIFSKFYCKKCKKMIDL